MYNYRLHTGLRIADRINQIRAHVQATDPVEFDRLRRRRVELNTQIKISTGARNAVPSLAPGRNAAYGRFAKSDWATRWRKSHQRQHDAKIRDARRELATIAKLIGPPLTFWCPRRPVGGAARIARQYDAKATPIMAWAAQWKAEDDARIDAEREAAAERQHAAVLASQPDDEPVAIDYIARHAELKLEQPGYIALMRIGDFYETFGADAVLLSQCIGLSLTKSRDGATEMAGVPFHAIESYLRRIVALGHRVGVCDAANGFTRLMSPAEPATVPPARPSITVEAATEPTPIAADEPDADWIAFQQYLEDERRAAAYWSGLERMAERAFAMSLAFPSRKARAA